jgi:hypothetical protein
MSTKTNDEIDICPGGWGEIVDLLGNQTHAGYIALEGLSRGIDLKKNGERLRVLREILDQIGEVQRRLHLCNKATCDKKCPESRFILQLKGEESDDG